MNRRLPPNMPQYFPMRDVLSISTGIDLTGEGMPRFYEVMDFLNGEARPSSRLGTNLESAGFDERLESAQKKLKQQLDWVDRWSLPEYKEGYDEQFNHTIREEFIAKAVASHGLMHCLRSGGSNRIELGLARKQPEREPRLA